MNIHTYNSIFEESYRKMIEFLNNDNHSQKSYLEHVIIVEYHHNHYVFQFYFEYLKSCIHINSHIIQINNTEYKIENSFMMNTIQYPSTFYIYSFLSSIQNEQIHGLIHGHLLNVYYYNKNNPHYNQYHLIYDYEHHIQKFKESHLLHMECLTINPDWFPFCIPLEENKNKSNKNLKIY